MPDHDVTMEFTVPDLDYDAAGDFVNEVAEFIIDRTGWSVASHIEESKPEPDHFDTDHGGVHHPLAPLNGYEAANLLEALKLVPDTGDWHGQLRIRANAVLDRERELRGRTYGPNMPAAEQIDLARVRLRHLETEHAA